MNVNTGSPPRAWGRLADHHLGHGCPRFTPTCVGKAGLGVLDQIPERGSPPRAWGRRRNFSQLRPQPRFTPTCVGKASTTASTPTAATVHPHVRGEGGRHALQGGAGIRFTPTCVGKANACSGDMAETSVHPHVRGEGGMLAPAVVPRDGSPPRAWGRQGDLLRKLRLVRFTPTCVGKAFASATASSARAVHPHVRGEGSVRMPWDSPHAGSPPRAWGRPEMGCGPRGSERFTPTCVGKATSRLSASTPSAVHPHVRGEGS